MKKKTSGEVKQMVREGYAQIARQDSSSSCSCSSPCCGSPNLTETISKNIGYTEEDLKAVPEGANLGLGCGNPVALATLKEGETVLDLGSGAGFDCFLAANLVGKSGKVIGVDMTPDMLDKARENARKGKYRNVEFRLGEIENLPAADNSVDVVMSNCVINLSPDKSRVFKEAFRVLRPGGRMIISDIVLLCELPDRLKESIAAYVGCLSGALLRDKCLKAIKGAGFQQIDVIDETVFPTEYITSDPTAKALIDSLGITAAEQKNIAGSIISMKVSGVKPLKRVATKAT